ncbi:MAG: RNA pyrophosphohydrolase [Alphaproteobacteria bacterium ADurb.Bin438]|nr:MAG: RNA pyrophosphohydrolase [Alphaproteobacteria bacterium ADurb.Bin438]
MNKRRTARAILITKDNKLCVIKRIKKGDVYYVTPGGGIEEGETPLMAIIRELREEIGSDCSYVNKAFEIEDEKQFDTFYVCYECERIKPNGPEHQKKDVNNIYEIINFEIEDLEKLNLVPAYIKDKVLNLAKRAISNKEKDINKYC